MNRWAVIVLIGSLWATPARADYLSDLRKANEAVRAGNFKLALERYRSLIERTRCPAPRTKYKQVAKVPANDPCRRRVIVMFNVAQTHRRMGQHAATVAGFRDYLSQWKRWFPQLERYPLEERAHFEIGAALTRLKRYQEARKPLKQSLQLWETRYPDAGVPAFASDAHFYLAESLRSLGRKKEAATEYEQTLASYQRRNKRAHPDAVHLRQLIKDLRKPKVVKIKPVKRKPIKPRPIEKSNTWLYTGIGLGVAALASEAVGLAFYFRGRNKFTTDPSFTTDRALMITGHVLAGAFTVASAISFYLYSRDGEAPATTAMAIPVRGGAAISIGGSF